MTPDNVEDLVRKYIIEKFLPHEDPKNLADATPLVAAGVLDSLATLELVTFLEETFGIRIKAHEVNVENLDTIEKIARFVRSKAS